MTRPSWDETGLALAQVWAERAQCTRRQVGAVVMQQINGRWVVIGNGYNGVASGKRHCTDGGCPRGQLSYSDVPAGADYNAFPCRSLHAEHNAILQAGLDRCMGATLYVTDAPCRQCTNLIEHAGIRRVVVMGHPRDNEQPNPHPILEPEPEGDDGDSSWPGKNG